MAGRELVLGALFGLALVLVVGLDLGFLLLGFAWHGCHGCILHRGDRGREDNAQLLVAFMRRIVARLARASR